MLGQLLGGFIVILLGVVTAPLIANQVQAGVLTNATGQYNVTPANPVITGASATIFGLVTLFYCLAVASVGIGITTAGLRNAGLM